MQDKREAQLAYELDSDTEAQAQKLRELVKASAEGDLSLPRAHALVGSMCGVVAELIAVTAEEKTRGMGGKYKSWLRALPTDVAAVIAIRECIRQCSGPETHVHVQDLTFAVGKLWELEVRIRQAEAVNPLYMQRIHDQVKENATQDMGHLRRLYGVAIERVFKGTLDLTLTKAEMMQIGKFGVDACLSAGIIEQTRGTNKNGTMVSYELNEEVATFLRGYDGDDVRRLISKEETRMLCPPDTWTNLTDGGYLSIRRKAAAPLMAVQKLRKGVRSDVAAEFTAEKMPEVFSAANYLQGVAYAMHEPTRQAIMRVWKNGGGVMGVPKTTPAPRPEFPFGEDWVKEGAPPDQLEVFNVWKRRTAMYFTELKEWRGRVREVGGFVKSTRNPGEAWWFPVYMDTRGRWYYRGTPNPQGSDLAKAVLHFHERRKLGADGLLWLKVHIATSYGFDKARPLVRAEWTETHWPQIVAALDNPEDHPDVWGTDAPWCMFAAAWELREAMRHPEGPQNYRTGVPVHMDATCSGLQHFSAMLRDPVGGKYVNLFDSGDAEKQDIYRRVAENTLKIIARDAESDDPEIATLASWCVQAGIPRALAKKPVMTYVYGATLRGTAEHIEHLMEREVLPPKGMTWLDPAKSFEHSMYIAKKLFAGIAAAVPSADQAMRWLKDIARQQPAGKRMVWTTPTGFKVQHDYQDYTDTRIRLNSCGIVFTWAREWAEGTRQHAMVNAISPNFVHALDASHLTMVANRMNQSDLCMVAIHDSFGTHPCDVSKMHDIIRQEFKRLYSRPNLLAEFLWEVGGVGEPPTRGSLDLELVIDSEFMFC